MQDSDAMSEAFTASRHNTKQSHHNYASGQPHQTYSRGEESTASRQLRLIQNRYAKQSAQMMDDNEQFEQIIDEEDQDMQSSSRGSLPVPYDPEQADAYAYQQAHHL